MSMTIPTLRAELDKHFGRGAGRCIDHQYWLYTREPAIDVLALDDWLHSMMGYTEETHGSMADFIKAKVSPTAKAFVRAHIGGQQE